MKLSALCELIESSLPDEFAPGELIADLAVIRGKQHWDHSKPGWLYSPGASPQPLSPEMEFSDQFIRFEYVGHYPISVFYFHDSEQDLIEHVLSEAGHFNPFTSVTVVLRNGAISPFACYYKDESGVEHLFTKQSQLESKNPFELNYFHRRLAWV